MNIIRKEVDEIFDNLIHARNDDEFHFNAAAMHNPKFAEVYREDVFIVLDMLKSGPEVRSVGASLAATFLSEEAYPLVENACNNFKSVKERQSLKAIFALLQSEIGARRDEAYGYWLGFRP